MRHFVPILSLAALAACATPQERCERDATRTVKSLDRQIFETRQNLAFGYDVQERNRFTVCLGGADGNVGVSFCADGLFNEARARRNFDSRGEAAKLSRLTQLRDQEAERAQTAIAACPAPEEKETISDT